MKTKTKTKAKTETIAGEDTYAGALRAPRAGSPAFVFVFVFVCENFACEKISENLGENLGENFDQHLGKNLDEKCPNGRRGIIVLGVLLLGHSVTFPS